MKVWVGDEVEGQYKGRHSLFIASTDITMKEIKEWVNQYNISQIYFGAGKCSYINQSTVIDCIKYYKKHTQMIITLEIKLNDIDKYPKVLLHNVNLIITINSSKLKELVSPILGDRSNINFKLQSVFGKPKFLIMASYKDFVETNMNKHEGKTYAGDVILR